MNMFLVVEKRFNLFINGFVRFELGWRKFYRPGTGKLCCGKTFLMFHIIVYLVLESNLGMCLVFHVERILLFLDQHSQHSEVESLSKIALSVNSCSVQILCSERKARRSDTQSHRLP